MEAITYYVRGAFSGLPETPEVLEQQEEIIADLNAKVADLIGQGRTAEEALGMAIASLGDLGPLVSELDTRGASEAAESPAVPVYVSRLRLHSVLISTVAITVSLLLVSAFALLGSFLGGSAIVLVAIVVAFLFVWVGYLLLLFHRAPSHVAPLSVLAGARQLRIALIGWGVASMAAAALNLAGGGSRPWAWVVWVGASAWPLAVFVQNQLLGAGRFAAPVGETAQPASAPDSVAGVAADAVC